MKKYVVEIRYRLKSGRISEFSAVIRSASPELAIKAGHDWVVSARGRHIVEYLQETAVLHA